MSVGAAISSSLHVLEEEQRQEDDGVSIFLQLCQVPRRAAQLHRYTCHGYTCEEGEGRVLREEFIPTLPVHMRTAAIISAFSM